MHSALQWRTSTEEYCLSKDVDVSLWLDYRAYHQMPTLREIVGFVIVDASLHKEYEEFRATNAVSDISFLPQNELLQCWCRSQKLSSTRRVQMYGCNYVQLFASEVDQLCTWVCEKQDQVRTEGWESLSLSQTETQQRSQINTHCGDSQPSRSEEEPGCEITSVQLPDVPMSKIKRRQQKQLQKMAKRRRGVKRSMVESVELGQPDLDIV